jgi:phosphoribosylaminoimidazole (AIR) synthetase
MYRVFNMGLGMVLICSQNDVAKLTAAVPEAIPVGEVVEQEGEERVAIV